MASDPNKVILPLKVILILLQFFLVILIGYSRVSLLPLNLQEEFIYVSIRNVKYFETPEYVAASNHTWIAAGAFTFLLFAEFLTLAGGVSVMFKQINVIQIVLHGLGVLSLVWMILSRWSYLQLDVVGVFTGLIPFLLEIGALFGARTKFKVITQIQSE